MASDIIARALAISASNKSSESAALIMKNAEDISVLLTPANHRNIYRGKNLGTAVTSEQKAAISNGTFDDLFIGDYWTLNGTRYDVADMDYWYNCGDTAFTKHHLVMIPHTILYNAKINENNSTEGGYVGSEMYTANLEQAKTKINTDFGTMLLTHREYLTNAVTNGRPSSGTWFDSTVELMNEIMVYGGHVHTPANNGTVIPIRYTIDKQQLAVFALNPRIANIRSPYWLRDVVSAADFAVVNFNGVASYYSASNSLGVRPVFAIG